MLAEPRVFVLIKVSAVEESQAVNIAGKVRGDPIEDHADVVAVEFVDEIGEIIGRSKSGRGSEVADRLIAPRTVERMLADRGAARRG